MTGDHGIRAQFDDGTLTVRTLRATVASSFGVEEFVVKRVVKKILYAALDKRGAAKDAAKDQRHRGVFSRPSHWKDNYGFIIPEGGGEGIYAHRDNVRAGCAVKDGDAVKFYIAQHYRDHDQATDIMLCGAAGAALGGVRRIRRRGAAARDRRRRPAPRQETRPRADRRRRALDEALE